MKNCIRRHYDRINFCFTDSSLAIDIDDKQMVEAIKTQNYSLLVHYFRKHGMKNLAINTLLQQRKYSKNMPVVLEIIHTYLYFDDFAGALKYIKHNEMNNRNTKPIESLIKIHLAKKHPGCGDSTVFNLVKVGLENGYDRRLIKILKDFYFENCTSACLQQCLREKFTEIQKIIEIHHYNSLNYKEAKFLYKMMPLKHPFLVKMIKCNPFIKKRYYIEYANIEGFQREDIIRILSVKYRKWAIKVAMYHGWVDEEIRVSMEMKFNPLPICINGKNRKEWLIREARHHHFHNKVNKEGIKNKIEFIHSSENNADENEAHPVPDDSTFNNIKNS